jgi:hypothetical protein
MQAFSVWEHGCQEVRICEILDGCQWNSIETAEKKEEYNNAFKTSDKGKWGDL